MTPPHDDAEKKLLLLEDISELINRSHDLQETLDNIVRLVAERMNTDVCSIYLWDEEEKSLLLKSTVGLKVANVRLKLGEGLTSLAMERLQPVITSLASKHPRYRYFPETGEEEFDTFLGVPLVDRGQPIGVMVVQNRESRPITPSEVWVLTTLATQLTAIIRSATILNAMATDRDAAYLENLVHPKPLAPIEPMMRKAEEAPPFLRGKSVGKGVALGRIHLVRTVQSIAPSATPAADAQRELERLESALETSKRQIRKVQKDYAESFSDELAAIFTTHLMILEDEAFIDKIRSNINDRANAEEAVRRVAEHYEESFAKIEDPYLQERVADLRDIANRLEDNLSGRTVADNAPELSGRIIFLPELTPSAVVQYHSEEVAGIVVSHGGATSHASILGESLQIPMVVGVNYQSLPIKEGDKAIVDGNSGTVYLSPNEDVIQAYERAREQYLEFQRNLLDLDDLPAETTDGQRVRLLANIGFLTDLKLLDSPNAEGIGLYRTEFPFINRYQAPTEAEQMAIYGKVIDWARGRPVTIRTLDVGGDKFLPYLSHEEAVNPVLGLCSLRLSFENPELFKTQLRAVLRVAVRGNIRLLFPMVSGLDEMIAAQQMVRDCADSLRREGIPHHPSIPIGAMIEIPSLALLLDRVAPHVDFFSVGTNDLIQYTLAVDRGNEKVARYYDPLNTAVLRLLANIVETAERYGKEVTLCGEMASDPFCALALIGLGYRNLSMTPARIPLVKRAVRSVSLSNAKEIAQRLLESDSQSERQRVMEGAMSRLKLEPYH